MAAAHYDRVRFRWGFYEKAWLRANSWIRPNTLQEWYDEIAEDPAGGTPTGSPTIFHRYFAADWSKSKYGFRFWYNSPYKSRRTGENWTGIVVYVERVEGNPAIDARREKEVLTLIGKILDLITACLNLGTVIIKTFVPTIG